MALSNSLASQFAKIISQPVEQKQTETTVTGTAVEYAGKIYVQLDGSDQLTPIASSTVGMKDGDRVTVQIKNHSATATGNTTDPAASSDKVDSVVNDMQEVSDQITEFEIAIGDKVSVEELEAESARIDNLISENVTIKEQLTANSADIRDLEADNVTINEKLTAAEADIDRLDATVITADVADLKYATIESLEATNADIHNLEADYGDFKQLTTDDLAAMNASITNLDAEKLDAEQAEILYANIDFANIGDAAIENFFSKSGMIEDLVVSSGTVTGELVGVTIKGDLIEGGTVVADKLVILGDDGLYYKLNTNGETVSSEQTEYNSLSGTIITAKSITAEKISVNDLVAFGATIGGYHITDDSLYSGVKSSATNTTRGVFMNDDGEFAVGDANNFVKFFKDTDGQYKLAISASQISMGGTHSLEDAVNNAQTVADTAQNTADAAQEAVNQANLMIDSINASIASLVTDENGSSLMTQTSDGWTFNIGSLQSDVENNANKINEVIGDMSEVNNLAQQTNDLANDIAEKTAYMTVTQDESGDPALTLGRVDSQFRIRITNTSIDFLEGTQRIAYITNRQLYIQSSVVTDEMKIGATSGYVWKKRGNNHMGLRWVGEDYQAL